MDNKPAVGQLQIGRGRVEVKGIRNEESCKPCLLETNGRTDRAVMRLKVREFRRKLGSMGCHSVTPANHRAAHRDGPNRLIWSLAALTEVIKLKSDYRSKTSHFTTVQL